MSSPRRFKPCRWKVFKGHFTRGWIAFPLTNLATGSTERQVFSTWREAYDYARREATRPRETEVPC